MAGESAQHVFEREHARRRDRVQRTWGSIVGAVVIAFILGWVLSIVVMSVALSMVESIGTDGGQTFSVHRPPPVVSLGFGVALAVKAATLLLAPSRREVAWRKGAEGEQIVGAALDALISGGDVSVLHDRRIPGSRATSITSWSRPPGSSPSMPNDTPAGWKCVREAARSGSRDAIARSSLSRATGRLRS